MNLRSPLAASQQALSERLCQQSPDWIIARDELQLTQKYLGMGAWGSVVEGTFCGCNIAVTVAVTTEDCSRGKWT